jgi:hypothetical protein
MCDYGNIMMGASMNSEQAISTMPAMPQFKPDFTGEDGEYHLSIKLSKDELTSETMMGPDHKPWPNGRRWLQLLYGAKEIVPKYMKGEWVDIEGIAQQYGCTLIPFSDPFATELNLEPFQQEFLEKVAASGKKKKINGFSDPIKRKIFYSKKLNNRDKRFVIAHELSHFLLGHDAKFFCRVSDDKKPLETSEFHEESDRMAAILLMPHEYIEINMREKNKKIADTLEVPVRSVEKRKEEVYNEIFRLSYGRRH